MKGMEDMMRVLLIFVTAAAVAQQADFHKLAATPHTIAWGHYAASTPPVLRVRSGDTVEVETLITNNPARLEAAGVSPDQIQPALRAIYKQVSDKRAGRPHPYRSDLYRRGGTGRHARS